MASHSYGSILAGTLATEHPIDGADAYILTTASSNLTGIQPAIGAFHARAAGVVDPVHFGNFAPGYFSIAQAAVRDTLYSFEDEFYPLLLAVDSTSKYFLTASLP